MTFFIGTAWLVGAALLASALDVVRRESKARTRIAVGMSQAGRSALARAIGGEGDA